MNKKGVSYDIVRQIPIIFMIFLVAIAIYFGVNAYTSRKVDIKNLDSYVINNRLLFSDDCLAYNDEIKVYPGIIDLKKFNEQNLDNCMQYKEGLGYLVNLSDVNGNVIKTVEMNNEDLAKKIPFCSIKVKNFKCDFNRYYVLYYDNEIKEGILNIAVVSKNE